MILRHEDNRNQKKKKIDTEKNNDIDESIAYHGLMNLSVCLQVMQKILQLHEELIVLLDNYRKSPFVFLNRRFLTDDFVSQNTVCM